MNANNSAILVSAAWELLRPLQLPNYPDSASLFLTKISAPLADNTPADASGKLLTIKEVAYRMNISIRSTQALVRCGILPRIKIGHRLVRVPESAINQMIKHADPIGQPCSVQTQPEKRS